MVSINKIKKPTKLICDLDSHLFAAASSSQDIVYCYHTPDESFSVEFPSATEGKHWLKNIEAFGGIDVLHGYQGDIDNLMRTVRYEVGDVKVATKTFDRLLEDWLSLVPHKQWKGKVAAKSGAPCFRHEICTIRPYKGQRSSTKPYHIDDVRKHALTYPEISKSTSGKESDDYVISIANRYGQDCMAVIDEKDGYICRGTWFYAPSLMEEPYYSDENIVGEIWIDEKGRAKGCGYLYMFYLAIAGDSADNYAGCEGMGKKRTVNLLEPFSGKSLKSLEPCVHSILEVFRERYGDEYEYQHCYTGEKMVVSFKDVFMENLMLAHMVSKPGDRPEEVIQYFETFK